MFSPLTNRDRIQPKRQLAMEAVEKRELMAADVMTSADAVELASPQLGSAPDAEVLHIDEVFSAEISNGLVARLQNVDSLPSGEIAEVVDVWEHAYVFEDGQDNGVNLQVLSAELVDVAFSHRIGSSGEDGDRQEEDAQLSDAERHRYEQLIYETLEELAERLKVHWQLVDGEGPPVQ